MSTDDLTERIARAIHEDQSNTPWEDRLSGDDQDLRHMAAAVLPIVEAEVRAAKAEALREAALAILMDSFDASVADRLADAGYTEYAEDEDGGLTWVSAPLSEVLLIVRACATEYETGDSDEHR